MSLKDLGDLSISAGLTTRYNKFLEMSRESFANGR